MRVRVSSVLVVVTLSIGCGGAGTSSTPVSPTDPGQTSGVCRNYASSLTATTTTTFTGQNPSVATQNITTSYNPATNQFSAMGTGMNNNGICRRSVSWSTTYDSVADFVDEVSVAPPRTRWARQSGSVTDSGPDGPCGNGTLAATTTNSYDSQGRLVISVSTGGLSFPGMAANSTGTTLYTAWDAPGRPTAYSPPGLSPASISITYDDSARTRSTAFSTGTITTTLDAFDSDGNLVRSQRVTRVPPRPLRGTEFVTTTDTAFVITATTRVCR
jgi:hypothetical protein